MNLQQVDLIRKEEEVKGVREQLVQKSFQLRHLEEVNQENHDLQGTVSSLCEEIEGIRATLLAKSVEVKAPSENPELKNKIILLNNELNQIRLQNEEISLELKAKGPSVAPQ